MVEEKKPPKEEPSDRYVPPSLRAQGFRTHVKKPTMSKYDYYIYVLNH